MRCDSSTPNEMRNVSRRRVEERRAEHTRVVTLRERLGHRDHRQTGVSLGECLVELARRGSARVTTPPAATTWSRADSVSRAEPRPWCTTYETASSLTSRSASATIQRTCRLELVGGEQLELEVLGAAADGRQDLLRVGGGQHEDARGRAAPRASSAARSTPPATACGPRRGCTPWCGPASRPRTRSIRSRMASTPLLEAASSSKTSKLRPASMARQRVAVAARLAVLQVLAVERLGEDAGGGRLARAAGPAEEVGVADSLSSRTALRRAPTTCSWPRTSSKRRGRYRR